MSAAAAAAASSSTTHEVVLGDTSYRAKFNETLHVVGVAVHDPKGMSPVVKALHKTNKVYARKLITAVVDIVNEKVVEKLLLPAEAAAAEEHKKKLIDSHARVILLNVPSTDDDSNNVSFQSLLPQDVLSALISTLSADAQKEIQEEQQQQQPSKKIESALAARFSLVRCTVRLSHLNYSSTEILSALLPKGVVVPSGFEQVGHIAHLNLLSCHNDHKKLIAQVLLDCSAGNIRTVLNKTEALSSVFRELPFELLAGEKNYTASVKQHGIEFLVPYDKVYWNSKLSHEHTRLVTEAMQPGDELLDVMAGVGPFAVPAALQQHVRVFANDLNPAAAVAMRENAQLNKVPAGSFDVFNMDGRAFVAEMRDKRLKMGEINATHAAAATMAKYKKMVFRPKRGLRHFVMNLPATAVQFLDAFVGQGWPAPVADVSVAGASSTFDHTFVVHVYCFSCCSDNAAAAKDAVAQVAKVLGKPVGDADSTVAASVLVHRVHLVRDVAPNKLMVCVSFSPQVVAPPSQHAALVAELACFRSTAESAGGGGGGAGGARRGRD